MQRNILDVKNRNEFRIWLKEHADTARDCWIALKRGNPVRPTVFYYIDAVEEALCFGWIDSQCKRINGICYQKFTPRKRNSLWSELNKARVRRLEKLGMMTDLGRDVLPNMNEKFVIDTEIKNELIKSNAYLNFKSFPELYQRVRGYNVLFYKKRDFKKYKQAIAHLIEKTKAGKMFGEWNDYGRLLNY